MRYALVSDIHANLEALQAVFERLAPGDGLFCLGDVVGYGPNPNECVALLRSRVTAAILGNHDVAAIDDHGLEYFSPLARDAMTWTKGTLRPEHRQWLDGLSYEIRMPEYLLVHGAPQEYFAYTNDRRSAEVAFNATDAPLIFIGHTHVAEYYVREADGTLGHRHMQHGGTLQIEPHKRYIVNVGSVGQPRDLNPEGSFAFYDDTAKVVTWERVPYAIDRVRAKIGAAHLPSKLGDRLIAGR